MINKYLFFAIAILGMFSCQQVIDINLNESAPQFVFEAALEEGTHDFKVRATKTGNYFSTEAPTPIKDAIIKLSTEQGGELLLNNENNGYYTLNQYAALNNTDYKLTIQTEGKTFTASSYLPKSVVLDSVSVEKNPPNPFGGEDKDSLFTLFCNFTDPKDEVNYYQIKSVVNGIPSSEGNQILVFDDRLTNGNKIRIPIFTREFKLGDVVEVYLLSIDKKTFDYFNTLLLIVSDSNSSAAPANPISNWSDNALGYFGAYSVSSLNVLVK